MVWLKGYSYKFLPLHSVKYILLISQNDFQRELETQRLQYDFDAKMMYTELSSTNVLTNITTSMMLLQDYKTMKQYITLQDGKCYVQPWTSPMRPPCIPDDAAFLGEVTLGGGSNTIKGLAYSYFMDGAATKIIVDAETCTPIVDASYGTVYGVDQALVMLFYDFVPALDDATKLAVPANCDTPLPTMPAGTDAAPVGRR